MDPKIQQLALILTVLCHISESAEKAIEDKGGFLAKAAHFVSMESDIAGLFGLNFTELKTEAQNLQQTQVDELIAALKQNLVLDHAALAAKVVEGVEIVEKVVLLAREVLAFVKA